jgi:D-alanine-D-alanine ligase
MSGSDSFSGSVLVLQGGPDAEREVSLLSAGAITKALRSASRGAVHLETIDRIDLARLRALPGDVIFPVLHGQFGEGGPLQDLLEQDGRPFVGCKSRAARAAMDKLYTKFVALRSGVPCGESAVFNPLDTESPVELPLVLKPVHDGSSVGLHLCRDRAAWEAARLAAVEDLKKHPARVYSVERLITGREITAGVLDGKALPLIEITPADGVYDFQAKYYREDTRYQVEPALPHGMTTMIQNYAVRVATAIGVRHLCRVDFILDRTDTPWLLEVNTMPGFTDHSLVPMAARRTGLEMPDLCWKLVGMAVRDHESHLAGAGAAGPGGPLGPRAGGLR